MKAPMKRYAMVGVISLFLLVSVKVAYSYPAGMVVTRQGGGSLQKSSSTDTQIDSFSKLFGINIDANPAGIPNSDERLDLARGILHLHNTDIDIPVTRDLAIRLGRSYSSNWSNHTTLWHLSAGYIQDYQHLGGYNASDNSYNALYVGSDGITQQLIPSGSSYTTPLHWTAAYHGDSGYTLYDTQGNTYTFGNKQGPNPNTHATDYYLTKINDLHGNSITFNYDGASLTGVSTSDGKVLAIHNTKFSPVGPVLPTSITFNGKTLRTYHYQEITVGGEGGEGDCYPDTFAANDYVLTQVDLPDGRHWQYGYGTLDTGTWAMCRVTHGNVDPPSWEYYHGGTIYYLNKVVTPDGEVTTYTMGFFIPETLIPNLTAISASRRFTLASQTNTDPNGTQHTWTFKTLSVGSGIRTVRITGPDYAVDDTYGFWGNGVLWRQGLLLKRITYVTIAAQNPIQTETFNWDKQTLAAQTRRLYTYAPYGGDPLNIKTTYTDSNTWVPILTSKTISRGGITYTTNYSDYDNNGEPGQVVQIGDGGHRRTAILTYYHNPANHIASLLQSIKVDKAQVLARQYNTIGDITEEDHYAVPTYYTYDGQGNIISETDALGHTTTFNGYQSGIPTIIHYANNTTVKQTVNPTGTIANKTDARGNTTQYTYDTNRVLSITPPKPMAPTTINYNGFAGIGGNTRNVDGLSVETKVDGFGNPVVITKTDANTHWESRIDTTYDGEERHTFISYPYAKGAFGVPTHGHYYHYDSLNRVLDDHFPTATGTYDKQTHYGINHQVTTTDPNGNTTLSVYQSYGDPKQAYLSKTLSPAGTTTTYERDSLGHLLSVSQGGFTRSFHYDPHFYLINVTNPETGVTRYGRDADGNMISRTLGGAKTTYAYDACNHLIATTYPDKSPVLTKHYDAVGNVTLITKGASTWHYIYDADNHVTDAILTIDGHTFKLHYARGPYGMATSITYPDGTLVLLLPDSQGHPTMVGHFVPTITYYPTGQWQTMAEGNGTDVMQTLNRLLRPKSLTYQNDRQQAIVSRSFTYDANGNLTFIQDNQNAANDQHLAYDEDNRMLGGIGTWGSLMFSYSPTGDILSKQVLNPKGLAMVATTYHYDPQKDTLISLSGGTTQTFHYDSYGDIISDATHHYTYDADGNLVAASAPTTTATYSYDGNGHRVKISNAQGVTYNIYNQAGLLLYQTNTKAGWQKDDLYVEGHKIAQQTRSQMGITTHYYDSNLEGSPLAERDASGKILNRQQYAPWGMRLTKTDSGFNTQWYDGMPEDKATALDYDNARYYNPAIGRFMRPDPAGFSEGKPMTFNRYMYANDNPYLYEDRTGKFPDVFEQIAGAIVGGIVGFAEARAVGAGSWDTIKSTVIGSVSGAVASLASVGFSRTAASLGAGAFLQSVSFVTGGTMARMGVNKLFGHPANFISSFMQSIGSFGFRGINLMGQTLEGVPTVGKALIASHIAIGELTVEGMIHNSESSGNHDHKHNHYGITAGMMHDFFAGNNFNVDGSFSGSGAGDHFGGGTHDGSGGNDGGLPDPF